MKHIRHCQLLLRNVRPRQFQTSGSVGRVAFWSFPSCWLLLHLRGSVVLISRPFAGCRWLREHGLVLVVADELLHETMQPDRAQTGLPPVTLPPISMICLYCTFTAGAAVSISERDRCFWKPPHVTLASIRQLQRERGAVCVSLPQIHWAPFFVSVGHSGAYRSTPSRRRCFPDKLVRIVTPF